MNDDIRLALPENSTWKQSARRTLSLLTSYVGARGNKTAFQPESAFLCSRENIDG